VTHILFLATLLCVCGIAFWRGGQDERWAAIAVAVAAFLSPFAQTRAYSGLELGLVMVDAGLFVALAAIARRSRAFWPMWAAGLQLCSLAGHFAAAKSNAMVPAAYAETLIIWSYAVLATLLVGTLVEGQQRHGRG
jgi:hypothetical protein